MTRRRDKRAGIFRKMQRTAREIHDSIGVCPDCGKKAYVSRATAKAVARQQFPGMQLRFYRCDGDSRWWHQTSEDSGTARQWRDQLVFRQGEVVVVEADALLAARFAAEVVTGTGAGPSQAQLARVMGWPRGVLPRLMPALARAGWLEFTREPGSLRPGPRYVAGDPGELRQKEGNGS